MEETFVAGIGAANLDLHGHSRAPLILRDSNPGSVYTSAGGVTRNILENLCRMEVSVRLFSAVGDDANGGVILEESRRAGMDVSQTLVVPGERSSCYLALMDSGGDMYAALSDMSILEHVKPCWLETKKDVLLRASAVVCDPCLPPETLEWITGGALAGIPLFADPVSTAYARRLRPFAGKFACLKPNRMELAALTGQDISDDEDMERAAEELLDQGTRCVVVSLGPRGCYWADRDGNRFYRSLRPVERMVDATGAGDAFMAGIVYGFMAGMAPLAAARWALAAGVAAVTSKGTVSTGMSQALIRKILEENV